MPPTAMMARSATIHSGRFSETRTTPVSRFDAELQQPGRHRHDLPRHRRVVERVQPPFPLVQRNGWRARAAAWSKNSRGGGWVRCRSSCH